MTMFPEAKLLIDGELRQATSGATYSDISPWTGEEIARVADASLADLDAAIGAARKAFDTTDWSTNHPKRIAALRVFTDLLLKNRDRFAEVAKHEVGAASGELYMAQCDAPLNNLNYALDLAESYEWEQDLGLAQTMMGQNRRKVLKEAVGVVAAITPWNVPTQINMAKVIPALAAGCTVILKPAPESPILGTLIGEIAVEAGLPKGVFNVITSSGPAEIGEAMVKDKRVDSISFTGSTGVGKRIMANASERIARVFLELGGKSASIVLDDANFGMAVGMAAGLAFHAGQGCAHLTRLLVPKSRYEEAIEILKMAFGHIQYGDINDPSQIMGPLISKRQQDRVLDYIRIGKEEGARLVLGGGIPAGMEKGFFVEPTVFADVTNDMRIAQEEIFGPVLCVIGFDTDEEAIAIANDSPYGLSGAVWSTNMERAMNVVRKVRTGTMGINGGMWYGVDCPFGGYKQSGVGREMGVAGFEEYLELKTIALPEMA
jgi:aldehyde dehydrogenase (NAD+)